MKKVVKIFLFILLFINIVYSSKAQVFTEAQLATTYRFPTYYNAKYSYLQQSKKSTARPSWGFAFGFGYKFKKYQFLLSVQEIQFYTTEEIETSVPSGYPVYPYKVLNKNNRVIASFSSRPSWLNENLAVTGGVLLPVGKGIFNPPLGKNAEYQVRQDSSIYRNYHIAQYLALRLGMEYKKTAVNNLEWYASAYIDYHLPDLDFLNIKGYYYSFQSSARECNLFYFNAAAGLRYYFKRKNTEN